MDNSDNFVRCPHCCTPIELAFWQSTDEVSSIAPITSSTTSAPGKSSRRCRLKRARKRAILLENSSASSSVVESVIDESHVSKHDVQELVSADAMEDMEIRYLCAFHSGCRMCNQNRKFYINAHNMCLFYFLPRASMQRLFSDSEARGCDRRPLRQDRQEHYLQNRYVCPLANCQTNFCQQCKVTPYVCGY